MANERTCAYCGAGMAPKDEVCLSCGAPNPFYNADHASVPAAGTGKPRTIEELRDFCLSRGMPLEKMRFFIGVDERSPRCYGIYRQGDRFIVYKNKSDGSRAVRYDGPDEAYAVRELYEKLMEEHRLRQGGSGSRGGGSEPRAGARRRSSRIYTVLVVLVILVYFLYLLAGGRLGHRNDGYYRLGEWLFYRYGSSWYVDAGDDWVEADAFPAEDYGSYFAGDDYDESWGGSDFTDSWAWEYLQDSDDDSDWDYDDYDYDDWDSGGTDWDSDW